MFLWIDFFEITLENVNKKDKKNYKMSSILKKGKRELRLNWIFQLIIKKWTYLSTTSSINFWRCRRTTPWVANPFTTRQWDSIKKWFNPSNKPSNQDSAQFTSGLSPKKWSKNIWISRRSWICKRILIRYRSSSKINFRLPLI